MAQQLKTDEEKKKDPVLKALYALIRTMKKAKAAEYAKKMGVTKEAADSEPEEVKESEDRSPAGGRSGRLKDIVSAAVDKGDR